MRSNIFKSFRTILPAGLIFLFIFASCREEPSEFTGESGYPNSFPDIAEWLKNPPKRFLTVPLWAWNDRVTRENIDFQLKKFHEQGIGGVFINPRPGLITGYLSDEWFELCEYALGKAGEYGMYVWMYDEYSYPSGFAGGHVQDRMPRSYNQGQGLRMIKTGRIGEDDVRKEIVVALKKSGDTFTDITDNLAGAAGRTGEYYLFIKTYEGERGGWAGFPYPDLMIPGVTDTFISITMEGYERIFGDEFGKRVPGIFTDEPNIRPPSSRDIRWTPALFEEFSERWGYSLREHLPSLFENVGNYRKVRHDYYALLIDLFVENWSKPWYEYTEKHNLKWTGHYWEHAWPNPTHAGDNMVLFSYHQMPGIDMLFNNPQDHPDQFGNVMAGRELLSVADQFNRRRTFSETYAASGWSLDFESMKKLGDWEYVMGVNFMNQHHSYMTLKGARKREWPPSFSYHDPWWPHYHVLAGYFGRLSMLLSSGEHINHILVIEPTTTTWMYFTPGQGPGHTGGENKNVRHGQVFKEFLETLESEQIEYDLGSELVIRDHGKVEGNAFVIGERAYDMVILGPHTENLDRPTFRLLKEYLGNGGQVISFFDPPVFLDGEETVRIRQLVQGNKANWEIFHRTEDEGLYSMLASDPLNFTLMNGRDDKLYHQRRILIDGQLIFWENFSDSETAKFSFSLPGKQILIIDAVNGEYYQYPSARGNGRVHANCRLVPGESKLFFVSEKKYAAGEYPVREYTATLGSGDPLEIKRLEPNVLALDYCDLKIKDKDYGEMYYIDAADLIYREHGFEPYHIDRNPWNLGIQFRSELLDTNVFDPGTGFEAVFSFRAAPDVQPKGLLLVVEYGHLYDVLVNGRTVDPVEGEWWLDQSMNVYDIEEQFQQGTNTVTLIADPMHVLAELEKIFITGDFGLEPAGRGFLMTAAPALQTGSWKDQMMPFYPSTVSYSKTIRLDEDYRYFKLQLNEWSGTVASVKVNGKQSGIIGWKPYELDISEYIHPGENEIVVTVYGSLKNTLGPHHFVTRRGFVTPWSFNDAPGSQPPGNEYDLLDYGLFGAFVIMAGN